MARTFIIAEAGVNHNGDPDLAHKLVDAAATAGADAIKFQLFKTERLVTKAAPKADYQIDTTDDTHSQFEMLKKLELPGQAISELKAYSQSNGIQFLCTPFDIDSARFLSDLGVETIKIPSGEITNQPYLQAVAELGGEVIISTGMAYMSEVRWAIHTLESAGLQRDNITVLHCHTEYPTAFADVNLKAMQTMQDKLNVRVGYSDHTSGIEIAIAAVALGASVIEKHFTLSRDLQGPDHHASLEPEELTAMVRCIRNVEESFGDGEKRPTTTEIRNISAVRKSIVASGPIKFGELLTEGNITTKRPGTGLSPMLWNTVIGLRANRDYAEDELIDSQISEKKMPRAGQVCHA